MTVLTIILKLLTFPGAYMKGFFEQVNCKICGCLVESDGYLRMDAACGHVDHTPADKKGKAFLIAVLPGTFTFLFGLIFWLSGLEALTLLRVRATDSLPMFVIYVVLAYLGFSFLNNVFPMPEDAHNNWDLLYGKKSNANMAAKVLLFIPSALNMAGAYLEKFGINFLLLAAATAAAFILL